MVSSNLTSIIHGGAPQNLQNQSHINNLPHVAWKSMPSSVYTPRSYNIIGEPKPPYLQLIAEALESSPNKRMKVNEIYEWVLRRCPFLSFVNFNWKANIRHALTSYEYFVRRHSIGRDTSRGGFWTFNLSKKPQLMEKLSHVMYPKPSPDPLPSFAISTTGFHPAFNGALEIGNNQGSGTDLIPENVILSSSDAEKCPSLIGEYVTCGPEGLVQSDDLNIKTEADFGKTNEEFSGSNSHGVSQNEGQRETVHAEKKGRKSEVRSKEFRCPRCRIVKSFNCKLCKILRQICAMGPFNEEILNLTGEMPSELSMNLNKLTNFLDEDQEAPGDNWSKCISEKGETYILRAPHMDHEYCYLQRHLRTCDEKKVVEKVTRKHLADRLALLREAAFYNSEKEGLSFKDEMIEDKESRVLTLGRNPQSFSNEEKKRISAARKLLVKGYKPDYNSDMNGHLFEDEKLMNVKSRVSSCGRTYKSILKDQKKNGSAAELKDYITYPPDFDEKIPDECFKGLYKRDRYRKYEESEDEDQESKINLAQVPEETTTGASNLSSRKRRLDEESEPVSPSKRSNGTSSSSQSSH